MSTGFRSVRSLCAFLAAAGVALASGPALLAQDCPTDLEEPSGFTLLNNGNSANAQKGVEEWDGDTIKFRTEIPGVFVISGAGDGSQSALYTNLGETPTFVDSANLGTDLSDLQAVAGAGEYCIQVRPPGSASGDFTINVEFTDVCHLGAVDDHGQSFLCATPVAVDGGDDGEIDSGTTSDIDMFTFTLGSAATVTLASSGSTDVDGSLFDVNGTLIDSDEDSGTGDNFQIVHYLAAGKYYLRLEGADGAYGVSVSD